MKKLKQFSYFVQWGTYDRHTLLISATSQKQVIEMLDKIGFSVTLSDITNYFGKAWGNTGNEAMKDIEVTEPSVYAVKGDGINVTGTPIKLI